MRSQTMSIKRTTLVSTFLVGVVIALTSMSNARADSLPPEVQAKIDLYKKRLIDWAANPTIVAAAKIANAKGALAGMGNAKWTDMEDKDPVVLAFQSNDAGKLISKWDEDKGLSKLYLRDEKGNLVAASNKPLLYNNASKPWVANPLKDGKPWSAAEIKPDPATQIKGVHLSVPVLDGGKAIGVLHTSVIVE